MNGTAPTELPAEDEKTFKRHHFRRVGALQVFFAILMVAFGSYDLLVYKYGQWFALRCPLCDNRDIYYLDLGRFSWVYPATPLACGIMCTVHGMITSWTCHKSTFGQQCHRRCVIAWSICAGVVVCSGCLAVGVMQCIYSFDSKFYTLRPILTVSWTALAGLEIILSMISLVLACCTTSSEMKKMPKQLSDHINDRMEPVGIRPAQHGYNPYHTSGGRRPMMLRDREGVFEESIYL